MAGARQGCFFTRILGKKKVEHALQVGEGSGSGKNRYEKILGNQRGETSPDTLTNSFIIADNEPRKD